MSWSWMFVCDQEAINACKSETKRARGQGPGQGCSVYCCYPALSPIRTLRIGLLLLGEERDVVIYRPDRKSSECKKEEEDDDDNRDGDVSLNHVGRRSADRGREGASSVVKPIGG
ncbi:hypothetical protein N7536_006080 [Penicillium majusculum]|nr:hypothetical protein N7536_006080 [Penicillium majusculum]